MKYVRRQFKFGVLSPRRLVLAVHETSPSLAILRGALSLPTKNRRGSRFHFRIVLIARQISLHLATSGTGASRSVSHLPHWWSYNSLECSRRRLPPPFEKHPPCHIGRDEELRHRRCINSLFTSTRNDFQRRSRHYLALRRAFAPLPLNALLAEQYQIRGVGRKGAVLVRGAQSFPTER
jgi:hypothetical protein